LATIERTASTAEGGFRWICCANPLFKEQSEKLRRSPEMGRV
jgi:hypothetical protein